MLINNHIKKSALDTVESFIVHVKPELCFHYVQRSLFILIQSKPFLISASIFCSKPVHFTPLEHNGIVCK